jgi:hypothetical protein
MTNPPLSLSQAQMETFVSKWTGFGLSTTPADRPRAEEAVRLAYRMVGLPDPERIVWCSSPLVAALACAVTSSRFGWTTQQARSVSLRLTGNAQQAAFAALSERVGNREMSIVQRQVQRPVESAIDQFLRAEITRRFSEASHRMAEGQMDTAIWAETRSVVEQSLSKENWVAIKSRSWTKPAGLCSEYLENAIYGQHDAGWLSLYGFFREACGMKRETNPLFGLLELAQSAGWMIAQRDVCWISERLSALNRDPQGRFHCEDGPALAYPNSFAMYAWHGVRVPANVIEQPDTMTVNQINDERNLEVRRVMIERYGENRYLEDSSVIVHQDETGILYRRESSLGEPVVMIKVINSTPEPDGSFKAYYLRVPPTMQTAREAVAWTFGLTAEAYQPMIET